MENVNFFGTFDPLESRVLKATPFRVAISVAVAPQIFFCTAIFILFESLGEVLEECNFLNY